jgi:periplasmic glucans biosynthesis protein
MAASATFPQLSQAAAGMAATVPAGAFDHDWLVGQARQLSTEPFRPKPVVAGDLSYDLYRSIRGWPKQALWYGEKLPFLADFFHVGGLYKRAVDIFEVENGTARPKLYDERMFDFGAHEDAIRAAAEPAFAGLRLHYPLDGLNFSEFAVFLGASYFRSIGLGQQYGLSARGISIGSGEPGEEFPRFERFWIEKPQENDSSVTLHALLDSESLSGAFRFVIAPGVSTVMDVDATLFPRRELRNLGIAPLTSMFMRGASNRGPFRDFRPQVHDSEALSIRAGANEWIWRPLRNPAEVQISSFEAENPQGFGLLQRDRDFSRYLDLEARYDLRPGLWVEPVGEWGAGQVRLVEIPTTDEVQDNIVAFWTPERAPREGDELAFSYRLHWGPAPPVGPALAKVVGTYSGDGGVSSSPDKSLRKFVIDFSGANLHRLAADAPVRLVADASDAEVVNAVVLRNPPMDGWRVIIDARAGNGTEAQIQCHLSLQDRPITETWVNRWGG